MAERYKFSLPIAFVPWTSAKSNDRKRKNIALHQGIKRTKSFAYNTAHEMCHVIQHTATNKKVNYPKHKVTP